MEVFGLIMFLAVYVLVFLHFLDRISFYNQLQKRT